MKEAVTNEGPLTDIFLLELQGAPLELNDEEREGE